jgi:hypothetical protein
MGLFHIEQNSEVELQNKIGNFKKNVEQSLLVQTKSGGLDLKKLNTSENPMLDDSMHPYGD